MFSYKLHKKEDEILLAICDENLLGKTLKDNDLHIHVDEAFYADNNCGEKDVLDLINNATIINAVGEKIVSIMIKNNLVDKERILKISGVPHAQIVDIK